MLEEARNATLPTRLVRPKIFMVPSLTNRTRKDFGSPFFSNRNPFSRGKNPNPRLAIRACPERSERDLRFFMVPLSTKKQFRFKKWNNRPKSGSRKLSVSAIPDKPRSGEIGTQSPKPKAKSRKLSSFYVSLRR